jgi:hypothetical protein
MKRRKKMGKRGFLILKFIFPLNSNVLKYTSKSIKNQSQMLPFY